MKQDRLQIEISQGHTLWEALADQGVVLDRPCGGRGVCGGCGVVVEGIGRVNACQFAQEGIWQLTPDESASYTIVQADTEETRSFGTNSKASEAGTLYIAVDIGTTTVALTGICRGQTFQDGFVNPQRRFGADVVSRISAANAGHADEMREILKNRLIESLDAMADHRMTGDPDIENQDTDRRRSLCRVGIAGNTTMLHILRGFSCEGLGQAPFTPVDLKTGTDIWQGLKASYRIEFLPGISTYVGADIVSGIYALRMAECEEVSLLLDLGTNGEMVLGNSKRMMCASAAAGPAFEGGRLASLIHASGILKCLHKMLDQSIMDETGLLAEPYFEGGYPVQDGICITQDDIREIQMAKGAIWAGIRILMGEYGISPEQVSHIYLAGGMGYYLNPDDAVAIGLFPAEFAGRIQAVGNTSLRGLLRLAVESDGEELLAKIAVHTEEITLAQHPDFEEEYIQGMNFPI